MLNFSWKVDPSQSLFVPGPSKILSRDKYIYSSSLSLAHATRHQMQKDEGNDESNELA